MFGAPVPYRLTRLANESDEPDGSNEPGEPDEQRLFWEDRPLSELLLVRHAVVSFTGRGAELAELRAWRDGGDRRAACVLHGRGGQGKTRLVQHFAAKSAAAGWVVRQAVRPNSGKAGDGQGLPSPGPRVLVVVDYAERWPTDDLLTLLGDLADGREERLRVVLIARTAGSWWGDMRHELRGMGYACGTRSLSDLPAAVDRHEVFTAARQHFAARLGVDPDEVPAPMNLDEDGFGLMLGVQMAALVAVDAQRRGVRPPTDVTELSAYLLDREWSHWAVLHRNGGIAADSRAMSRTVLVATLVRARREDVGVRALLAARVTTNPDTARSLLADHAVPYPPRDRSMVLEPLYPDRLGEDFLALSVPGHDRSEHYDSPWSLTSVPALLASSDETAGSPVWAREALVGLVEAAHRWPHLVDTVLAPSITAQPSVVLTAGNATLERLAALPNLPIAVLDAIHGILPARRNTDLDAGIAHLETVRTEHHLANATDPAERADLHAALATRLADAGRHAAALVRTKKALALYDSLDVSHPARSPGIGKASNNCAGLSERLGRRRAALRHAARAVDVYRALVAVDATHVPHLATALDVHSDQLAQHGHEAESVVFAEEAVAIQRDLVATDPESHRPNLGRRLINYGRSLSRQGRYAEALPPTREAVEICRDLVVADPQAYLPELATALANLGSRLSESGRVSESLAPVEEAVGIRRTLNEINPVAHRGDLAMALNNCANHLVEAGRWQDALRVSDESLVHYRALAKQHPAAYRPDLATALHNHSARLTALDRAEEALAISAEVLVVYRSLADGDPAVFGPDVALALANHGIQLISLRRGPDALTVFEEAINRYRHLVKRNAAVNLPLLATVTAGRGFALELCDRPRDAVASMDESTAIYRNLADDNPSGHLSSLISSLARAASIRASTDTDLERGLALAEEAITLLDTTDDPAGATRRQLDLVTTHLLKTLGRESEVEHFRRRIAPGSTGDTGR